MTIEFSATISPDHDLLTAISGLSPRSPFNTPGYAAALKSTNAEPCALVLYDSETIVGGCLASIGGGRWTRHMEIFSACNFSAPSVFWDGVFEFCSDQDVCKLDVQTFASLSPALPLAGPGREVRERCEFIMDLAGETLSGSYSKNHKRSINKAARAGLSIVRSNDPSDYVTHIGLMQASLNRRSERGENVLTPRVRDFELSLLESAVGELFQSKLGDEVLASIFLLKTNIAAYYHSAGTLPDGMQLGASPFLISNVAEALRSAGYRWFNLGGTDPGADGLRRFKSGFGSEEIILSAEKYTFVSPVRHRLRRVAQKLLG